MPEGCKKHTSFPENKKIIGQDNIVKKKEFLYRTGLDIWDKLPQNRHHKRQVVFVWGYRCWLSLGILPARTTFLRELDVSLSLAETHRSMSTAIAWPTNQLYILGRLFQSFVQFSRGVRPPAHADKCSRPSRCLPGEITHVCNVSVISIKRWNSIIPLCDICQAATLSPVNLRHSNHQWLVEEGKNAKAEELNEDPLGSRSAETCFAIAVIWPVIPVLKWRMTPFVLWLHRLPPIRVCCYEWFIL